MKRLVLFLMLTMISCSGCSRITETLEFVEPEVLEADSLTLGTEVEEKGILEIREKYFLLQISDIFFNIKTIHIFCLVSVLVSCIFQEI